MSMVKFTGSKRKYQKTSDTPFSKDQAKAIVRIAKKVDFATAETKSYLGTSARSAVSDFWYASNLTYPIAQGTASTNVLGEKMYITNLKFRIFYLANPSLVGVPQIIRVAVVKAKQDFTNSHSAITAADVIRSPAATNSFPDFLDDHKIKIIRQYSRALNSGNDFPQVTVMELNVPIKRTEYIQVDNGGYFMTGNYYLLLNATDFSGVNTAGTFNFSWTVDFKDM